MDIFTIDDYLSLTYANRIIFDDWLNSLGVHAERSREVRIDGSELISIEYVVDSNKKLIYNYKKHDVETIEVVVNLKEKPPIWKSIVPPIL